MPYVRRTWQNSPSTATPLTATALNNIENGVEEALAAIDALPAVIESVADAQIAAQAADSGSDLRVELAGAFASTSLFDRKQTPRPPMTVLAPVVSGHSWTVPSTTGTSNLNDTTDWAVGDRCVTVTTPGDGNLIGSMIRHTGLALNMTGKGIVLWLKLVNGQNLGRMYIDIGVESAMTNSYRYALTLPSGGKSPLFDGDWVPLWLPFSVFNFSTTGSPTRSTLTAIRLYFGDTGGGNTVTVKVGGLALYTEGSSKYPNGVCTFTFDDASGAQASFGARVLAQKGYTATLFPIISRIGTAGNYTLDQLRLMVNAYGFELGAHAMDDAGHVSVVGRSQADVEADFRAMRQWAFDNGFPPLVSYAYPIGPFDKNAIESVRRYFGYGRTNDGKMMSNTSPHRYNASAFVLGSSVNLAAAKAAVDAALADKTWVNFVVHGLFTSSPDTNGWLQSDFQALVDYVQSVGLTVATAGDVINSI